MYRDGPLFCAKTDMTSPAPEIPQPFHLISDDEKDIEAMQKAESDPKLVILSDWSHYTSEEYQKIMEESGVDLLYGFPLLEQIGHITDNSPSAALTVF